MKIFKILFLVLLMSPILSMAQKNELMLGLSIGTNIPMGDFASKEYTIEDGAFKPKGQFAKIGTAIDFSASYRLGYYLGFAGRITGGINGVDTKTYSEALNKELSETDHQLSVASKGWGNAGAFFGAYFVIPTDQFYFDLRIMAGYLNLFSPELTYFVENLENKKEELFTREKYNAGAFAYDIGIGIKYNFSGNKFLLLNGPRYWICFLIFRSSTKRIKESIFNIK